MKNYILKHQINFKNLDIKNIFLITFILGSFYLFFGSILLLETFNIYFSIFFILSVANVLITFFFKSSFFNIYFNFYMWLGNFFFFTIHVIYFENKYNFGIGNFNFLSTSHVKELYLLFIIINLAIMIGTIISNYFIDLEYKKIKYKFSKVWQKKKSYILLSLIVLIIAIYILNKNFIYFDYYYFANYSINPILSSFLKWFFLFGFTSLFCVLIDLDEKKNFIYQLFFISSIQEFLFYNSILSRGCIFNSLAILIGLCAKKFKNFYYLRIFSFLFLLIFGLFLINFYILIYERGGSNYENLKKYRDIELKNNQSMFFNQFILKNLPARISLKNDDISKHKEIFDLKEFKVKANQILFSFKNRIFGVDSLMVLVSDENKSFKLLNDALKEKYQPGKTSFFDKIRQNNNTKINSSNLTLPTLPGFLYYSGSKAFVFFALILIIFLMNLVEKLNISLNSNIILTSLISQLLAYRLWHFGYAPLNSYKFFIAILFSILLAYFLKFALLRMKLIDK